MSELFVCEGLCSKCIAKQDCPYKNNPEFLLRLLARKIISEEIVLGFLMQQTGIFNLIQSWIADECIFSKKEVLNILSKIFWENAGEIDNVFIENAVNERLNDLAGSIASILDDSCLKKCHSCVLQEVCPSK